MVPALVRADAADVASAKDRFHKGIALEDAGQWAAALDEFRAALAAKATPAIRFHAALCLEKLGRLVAAQAEFAHAHADATSGGGGASAAAVAARSAEHLAALDGRLARLQVTLDAAPADVVVELDGARVDSARLAEPLLLDPGAHALAVHAAGRSPFARTWTLAEGERATVVVSLAPSMGAGSAASSAPLLPPPRTTITMAPTHPAPLWPAALVGGVAAASFAGALVFYHLRSSALSDLDASCAPDRTRCDPAKRSLESDARRDATVGNVLLAVGAVGALSAVVLLVTAGTSGEPSAHAGWSVQGGPQLAGATAVWRF